MENKLGFTIGAIAPYISLYWASLMIGRWTGAVEAFTDDLNFLKYCDLLRLTSLLLFS
ncbi:MAG TPA: hypothetical protein VL859_12590 [Flavobacterium sp.]|nr:hypothetical protein [Flavobacterium sp.]